MVKTCQNNVQTFTCRVPETNPIIHAIRKPTDLPAGSRALGPRFLDLPPPRTPTGSHPHWAACGDTGVILGRPWSAMTRPWISLLLLAGRLPLAEQPGGQGAMEVDALIPKRLACTGGGPALLFMFKFISD